MVTVLVAAAVAAALVAIGVRSPVRVTSSIGAVITPLRRLAAHSPSDVLDELLDHANAVTYGARRAGGNQHRVVVDPYLRILDEPGAGLQDGQRPA